MRPQTLVIVGASARALAQCAARAGWREQGESILAVDAFGDDDTRAATDGWQSLPLAALGRPALVLRAIDQALDRAAIGRSTPADVRVLLGGGFDGHPAVVEAVASRFALLNNAPSVWSAARAPLLFAAAGIASPETRLSQPASLRGWLCKRPSGSAGLGVRAADTEGPVWQRRVAGRPASFLFCAHRGGVLAVGFNRQWCDPTPQLPFRWGGVASHAEWGAQVESEVCEWAVRLTRDLGLRGLNTLDLLIDRQGRPLALELNPRPSASIELYDHAAPGLLALHLAAVSDQPLPEWRAAAGSRALAVVYADRRVRTGSPCPAHAADWRSGARIAAGSPVCTFHAAGDTALQAARRARRVAAHWKHSTFECQVSTMRASQRPSGYHSRIFKN